MLVLPVLFSEEKRQRLINLYIILSGLCFILSFVEFYNGVLSVELFEAPLIALERRSDEDLAYILIVIGLTGIKIHFLGMAIGFSQTFINKRTIGYTRLMTLLNSIKLLQVTLEIATVVLHHRASFQYSADRTNGFRRAMHKYSVDLTYKMSMDRVQRTFKCCGNEDIKDWLKVRWYPREYSADVVSKDVPFSCCNPTSQPPCQHDDVVTNLKAAFTAKNDSLLTVYTRGCQKSFYNAYSDFAIYVVCIPGCIKIALCFCLIPILRYVETSIYRALKTGFPQKAEYGYLFSCYESDPEPMGLPKIDTFTFHVDSDSASENSSSTFVTAKKVGMKNKIMDTGESPFPTSSSSGTSTINYFENPQTYNDKSRSRKVSSNVGGNSRSQISSDSSFYGRIGE